MLHNSFIPAVTDPSSGIAPDAIANSPQYLLIVAIVILFASLVMPIALFYKKENRSLALMWTYGGVFLGGVVIILLGMTFTAWAPALVAIIRFFTSPFNGGA